MAEREPMIVIKKITVQAAGHHGGSWKVAFADFMTALMAFFLVMWLLGQSDDVKKNVADYFSTPSIIEYNFSNFGAELTLEKLFLDLVNDPLKVFEAFVTPIDTTPNVMRLGTEGMISQHLKNVLSEFSLSQSVSKESFEITIPAEVLFLQGTAEISPQFVDLMDKLREITTGLENSDIKVDSNIHLESVKERTEGKARSVAEERIDLIFHKLAAHLEHPSVDLLKKVNLIPLAESLPSGVLKDGTIVIKVEDRERMQQKLNKSLENKDYGVKPEGASVFDGFVKQLSGDKALGDKSQQKR